MAIIGKLGQDLASFAHNLHGRLHELSGDALEDLSRKIDQSSDDFTELAAGLKKWAVAHPEPIFALLRRAAPILFVRDLALVTRFADVQEVLSRDDVFQVTYEDKFKAVTAGSNFFLGMQNSPEYTHDVSAMRLVFRREDIPARIVPFIEHATAEIVASCGGRLDVVADLTRIVPASLMADYVGIPGPSDDTMATWAAVISQYLFLAFKEDRELTETALAAAALMRDVIDRAIADRKRRRHQADDVLERCLDLQDADVPGMDDLSIRNNLLGIIVGAMPTTSAAAARAVDELLRRPKELAAAQEAAHADDDETVGRYVFEALRFNPVGPGVFRLATEDYTIAKGTLRAKTIPKGKTVVALIQSAMFDEEALDAPQEFRVDRPNHRYMHFGYGLHTCFGQYVNVHQVPLLAKAVLKCRSIERAPGAMGELKLDGPFPSSLKIEFQ